MWKERGSWRPASEKEVVERGGSGPSSLSKGFSSMLTETYIAVCTRA